MYRKKTCQSGVNLIVLDYVKYLIKYLQVFTTADLIKKGISEWYDWYHFN